MQSITSKPPDCDMKFGNLEQNSQQNLGYFEDRDAYFREVKKCSAHAAIRAREMLIQTKSRCDLVQLKETLDSDTFRFRQVEDALLTSGTAFFVDETDNQKYSLLKQNERLLGGMKRSGGMSRSGGMNRSTGMKSSGGMSDSGGMRESTGMNLQESAMKLNEVYQGYHPTSLEGILTSVGSALIAAGGAVMIVMTSGAAAPLVGMAILGTGISGSVSAITATANNRFCMLDFTKNFFIQAGTSIITLGAGYGIGGVVVNSAVAMSSAAARSVAVACGSLAGSGIHTGVYLVKCEVEGIDVEVIELVLNGLTGAIEGGGGAYLGAKAALTTRGAADQVSTRATAGDYEGFHKDVFYHDGRKMKIKILDRDGDPVRDIDFFHERPGGHGDITGPHTHHYGYNARDGTLFPKRSGAGITNYRPEDLPPPGSTPY